MVDIYIAAFRILVKRNSAFLPLRIGNLTERFATTASPTNRLPGSPTPHRIVMPGLSCICDVRDKTAGLKPRPEIFLPPGQVGRLDPTISTYITTA